MSAAPAGFSRRTFGGWRLTIAPVEGQHVAYLNVLIGPYPVPDTEIPKGMARSPADLRALALSWSPTAW